MRISETPWLEGPVGDDYIGAGFYGCYAREAGLEAVADEDAGLLPDFDVLAGRRLIPLRSGQKSGTSTSGRHATISPSG